MKMRWSSMISAFYSTVGVKQIENRPVWLNTILKMKKNIIISFTITRFSFPLQSAAHACVCVCVLHSRKDTLLLVSSSSQCCSGLVSCIYLKVVQRVLEPRLSVQVSDLQDAAHLHAQQWTLWSLHHCPCSTRWVGLYLQWSVASHDIIYIAGGSEMAYQCQMINR